MAEKLRAERACPDCAALEDVELERRDFMRVVGVMAGTAMASTVPLFAVPKATAAPTPSSGSETIVKKLYETLTPEQKKVVCFDWDYVDPKRGLLRARVQNNWHVTQPQILSEFYTKEQQAIAYDAFKALFNPEWVSKLEKQLKDDTGGKPWGSEQNIAIFGTPGSGKFQMVMTGRHLTVRCDGDSADNVAFGGPIFHGHAAQGFNEKANHPGNVFWHQALLANDLYKMLDGKQQKMALIAEAPHEAKVAFQGANGKYPGIPVPELHSDQKEHLQKVLKSLIAPYRHEDQDEVMQCLKKQGGLDKCSLAFYQEGDIGDDGIWDNWRLEGPAFVWYFRGSPHVHIWINVADDPGVKLNAEG